MWYFSDFLIVYSFCKFKFLSFYIFRTNLIFNKIFKKEKKKSREKTPVFAMWYPTSAAVEKCCQLNKNHIW